MNNIANTPNNRAYENRNDEEGQENREDERNRLPKPSLGRFLKWLDKSHGEQHEGNRL